MNTIKAKPLSGTLTLAEASRLEGWRLPTIFELRHIINCGSIDHGGRIFWSASVDDLFRNNVLAFDAAQDRVRSGGAEMWLCAIAIKGEPDFPHDTPVTYGEVRDFQLHGTLPDWHPKFTLVS